MTIKARNLFALAIVLISCSCTALPDPVPDHSVGSQPHPVGNLEASYLTQIKPLTSAEYGLGAPLLGTWEIKEHVFLTLEPEGSFYLKNSFMNGDPDPSYWLETGYWYILAGVLYLERTSYMKQELIPAELFRPLILIPLFENGSASAGGAPKSEGRTMRKVAEASPFQIDNYRIARSKSLTNPVDMLLPEPIVVEELKRYSEIWGDWEIDGEVSIRLLAQGRFIASEASPHLRKLGWAATGEWHIDTGSVILETRKRSFEQQMPAFLAGKEVRLSIVRSTQSGEISLRAGTQTLAKRLNF